MAEPSAYMDLADLRSELRRTWALLGDPGDEPGVRISPVSPSPTGDLAVYAAPTGARHLLVPGQFRSSPIEGPSLRVGPRRLVVDDAEIDFLDVECRQPSLFDVFDELVTLVVLAAQSAPDPIEAALEVIDDWRNLLRASPGRRLSVEQEVGLFAELQVLAELTEGRSFDPSWWRGPLREPKDIVTPVCWIEVKGVGAYSSLLEVHGLEQLADVAELRGYLAIASLDESDDGATLGELAASLRERATDPDRFDELLRTGGWAADSDSGRRWELARLDLVEARRCPRLTPASLVSTPPAGMQMLRYYLDIAVLRSFAERDAVVTLRAVAGDLP